MRVFSDLAMFQQAFSALIVSWLWSMGVDLSGLIQGGYIIGGKAVSSHLQSSVVQTILLVLAGRTRIGGVCPVPGKVLLTKDNQITLSGSTTASRVALHITLRISNVNHSLFQPNVLRYLCFLLDVFTSGKFEQIRFILRSQPRVSTVCQLATAVVAIVRPFSQQRSTVVLRRVIQRPNRVKRPAEL